jgi:lauroyl/myristoyl acyltransferase
MRSILPQRLPTAALEIRGSSHLEGALAGGKGALLISAHIGHPAIMPFILMRLGYRARHVTNSAEGQARYFADRDLRRWPWLSWISGHLMRFPQPPEPLRASLNVRPIYKALERNEAVLVLPDGLGSSRLVTSRVLEATVPISASTLDLARGRGVPVLPAFLLTERLWSPRLTLIIHEPMDLQYSDDREADLKVNADRYALLVEQYVEAYPHLYNLADFTEVLRLSKAPLEIRYAGDYEGALKATDVVDG